MNVSIKFHGDGCWDISLWTTNVGVKKKWEGESTDVILREPWMSDGLPWKHFFKQTTRVWTKQPILDPQRFYIWKTIFHFMVLNRLRETCHLKHKAFLKLIYTLIDSSLSVWYSTMVAATYTLLQLHHSSFLFAKNLDFFFGFSNCQDGSKRWS